MKNATPQACLYFDEKSTNFMVIQDIDTVIKSLVRDFLDSWNGRR